MQWLSPFIQKIAPEPLLDGPTSPGLCTGELVAQVSAKWSLGFRCLIKRNISAKTKGKAPLALTSKRRI